MVDGDQRVDAGIARRLQLLELQLFLVLRQGPQRIMVPADRPLTALTIRFPRPRGDGPGKNITSLPFLKTSNTLSRPTASSTNRAGRTDQIAFVKSLGYP